MSVKGVSYTNQAFDIELDFKSDQNKRKVSLAGIDHSQCNNNNSLNFIISQCVENGTDRDTHTSLDKKEDSGREVWSNQFEFFLSTVGYAVGLGNVWRFPYLAYKNGGGSFLIPYLIMLIIAGLPLFFLELVLGQYSRSGPIQVFRRISPIFKGLGPAMLLIAFFVSIYYNVIIAWTLFYMFKGFTTSDLPWSNCTSFSSTHCVNNFTTEYNATDYNTSISNDALAVGPSEDFFLHQMLGLDKEIHHWYNVGNLRWQLVLCLLGAWIIVCLCLIRGIKSSGKV